MTHPYNQHAQAHHVILTGRRKMPRIPKRMARSQSNDLPSIASIVGTECVPKNNLPPAVVLPKKLVHKNGHLIPRQLAGVMGWRRDPWFIEASPFCSTSFGAYPEYHFAHLSPKNPKDEYVFYDDRVFQAPSLTLPQGLTSPRFGGRLEMLKELDRQRGHLEQHTTTKSLDQYRQRAISMLSNSKVRQALEVTGASESIQEQYGRNAFGWSLLMARRLVEAGVSLIQVNLGNNETWDTHGNAFPHLKDKLFPPTDRALSALIDDLAESGLLDQTLIVMAGEFGRTPKIEVDTSGQYEKPGRGHWGASQTVFFAGGGVHGGNVLGATDKIGAYLADSPQTPENLAATIYDSLGIPATAAWHDEFDRPHHIYFGVLLRV